MSREPRRMEENVHGSGRLIVYIVTAIIIGVVIISYILIVNMLSEEEKEEQIAEVENSKQELEKEIIISDVEKEEELESVSTQIGKTVEESSNQDIEAEETVNKESEVKRTEETSENIESNFKTSSNEKNSNETVSNETEKEEAEAKEITFVMPTDGDIVRGFAKDSLVYSETLQEWIVHQAIDIKANSRDVIKAAAEGKVTAIKNDPRYGLTVIIEHAGGFKTVYSNLLTAEFVVEGEQVKQGQTLGTVGSSATFEIADEPHLHFEMLKDSEYVDPTIYIK